MTARELERIGHALYGERWQSALARALEVSDRTIRRWAAGATPIPAGAADEILELAWRDRAKKALDLIAELAKKEADGRMPIEIRLTEGRDTVGRRATAILAEALKALGVAVTIVPVESDKDDPAERARRAASAKP